MILAFPGVRYINARHCKTLRQKSTSILRRYCKIHTKALFQSHKIMQNNGIGPTSRCPSITSFLHGSIHLPCRYLWGISPLPSTLANVTRERPPRPQTPLGHIASPVNRNRYNGHYTLYPGIRPDTQKKRPEKFQSLLYWSG